jgi:hypothetical protein
MAVFKALNGFFGNSIIPKLSFVFFRNYNMGLTLIRIRAWDTSINYNLGPHVKITSKIHIGVIVLGLQL